MSHFPLHVALDVAAADGLAAVHGVLAAADGELDLHASLEEVEGNRNQRQALLLDGRLEAEDLPPVRQELPLPERIVVEAVAERVGRDRDVVQPQLPVRSGGASPLHPRG